jgi:hypothetical protein
VLAELGRCECVGRAWKGASMFAEPCDMRLCWQSLGDASVLAELGRVRLCLQSLVRCDYVGRAWIGYAVSKLTH